MKTKLAFFGKDYKPSLPACLITKTENIHALSHRKHLTPTMLEHAIDYGNTMREGIKRTTSWAAYYYTYPNSYYPVPVSHIPFEKFPQMARDEPVEITAGRYAEIKNWAAEFGPPVRQRSVRQDTTKYNAGTLPLNAHRTPLQPGDLINLDNRLNETENTENIDSEEQSNDSIQLTIQKRKMAKAKIDQKKHPKKSRMDTTSRSDSSSELVQPLQKSQQMQQHVNVNEDHREKEDEYQLSEYDSDSDVSVSDQLNEEEGIGGHCRYLRGLTQTRSGRSIQLSFKALEAITQF